MVDKNWRDRWLKVAEIIHNGDGEHCLCSTILLEGGPVLVDDLMRFANKRKRDVWFPRTAKYRELRVLFACLFSNMTQKEFDEVCHE